MEISARFPGFRFSPTDVELISHYLKRKIEGLEQRDEVIGEVDICKFEPWDLPAKSIIPSDHEWFFFSPGGRKYPNGSQARRATEFGYWKATGKVRFIRSGSNVIGTKRSLVFHIGRAPKGERTDWIMHEYCVTGHKVDKSQDSFVICRIRKKQNFTTEHDSAVVECESNRGSPASAGVSTASQVGSEMQPLHTGVYGDGKLMECCLNKQTSRLNSPVEPPDEPVLVQPNEGCSSEIETETIQDCNEKPVEDDCFADILNDDIVNLDKMSLAETPIPFPTERDSAVVESESNSGSPASGGVSTASQVGSEMQPLHTGVYGDGKLMECCLNKQTSRLNSPVEPPDEPVLVQPNEGCSSEIETETIQDCNEKSVEDDCFTDILKDDIVNLDKMSLAETPIPFPTVSNTSASERNSVQPVHAFTSLIHPFQGTAYRRIRLELHRSGRSHTQTSRFRDEGSMAEAIQQEARHGVKSLKSKSSYCRKIFKIFIIIVALLFLFKLYKEEPGISE